MDAAGGTLPIRSIRLPALARRPWQYLIGQTLTCIVATAAVLLTARRLAGALLTPLSALALIGVALCFSAAALVAIYLQSRVRSETAGFTQSNQPWMLTVSLLAIAISLSLTGSSGLGLAAMWLAIVGTEIAIWKSALARPAQIGPFTVAKTTVPTLNRLPSHEQETIDDAEAAASDATQTLKYQRIDGALAIDGWLRVDFAPGQRTGIAHVAFCPAFLQTPAVEAEFEDGPACDIRASLVIPWGVKWEVKLDETAVGADIGRICFSSGRVRDGTGDELNSIFITRQSWHAGLVTFGPRFILTAWFSSCFHCSACSRMLGCAAGYNSGRSVRFSV